jgi:hypothetical protein
MSEGEGGWGGGGAEKAFRLWDGTASVHTHSSRAVQQNAHIRPNVPPMRCPHATMRSSERSSHASQARREWRRPPRGAAWARQLEPTQPTAVPSGMQSLSRTAAHREDRVQLPSTCRSSVRSRGEVLRRKNTGIRQSSDMKAWGNPCSVAHTVLTVPNNGPYATTGVLGAELKPHRQYSDPPPSKLL